MLRRFTDIVDGTSKTAAFSEHIIGDFSSSVATPQGDTFLPGTYPSTGDQAILDCEAINPANLSFQGNSNAGTPWITASHTATRYFHTSGPMRRSCMFPPNRIMVTANSLHADGVHLTMCDGSVTFVSQSVDLAIWRAVGSRNGREVHDKL